MDTVLGQEHVVNFLRSRLRDPPHLILWGPTGTGKTMLANAWITEQLKAQGVTNPAHQVVMTLRFSSADDRGIAAVRQRLTEFVRRVRPVPNTTAWVLFDDSDNLPSEKKVTQQALRRILELYAHQTRFCFVAPSPDHFIEPIQSRCVMLQCSPVDLTIHGPTLLTRHAPNITVEPDAISLMAGLCMGNARQFALICHALHSSSSSGPVSQTDIQLLVNAPPVTLLLRLQGAIVARNIGIITECVLALWSKGYSFEDCIAMLEMVVRVYNPELNSDLQYVLQVCAEGHIYQILNRMTTLDLIAIFAGSASSECLAEVPF
jgi:SpoVK/Ycf46/Vps4 family AAA+-type ATPase